MNETIRKFGHPATLIAEWEHWVLLLRPAAVTLGSCVLAAKGGATSFAALPAGAHAELAVATAHVEAMLRAAVDHDKLNYLMLMMVDPHVHFHVIPRYASPRERDGRSYPDEGWPKQPALGSAVALHEREVSATVGWLRRLGPPTDGPASRP